MYHGHAYEISVDNVHENNHSLKNAHQTTTNTSTCNRNTLINSCKKTGGQTWCVERVNCERPQSTGKI